MIILSLDLELIEYLEKHNLTSKFNKQTALFISNPRHPGLHNELLEPKEKGIRSFRIDRTYRALFTYDPSSDAIEIIAITKHYK